MTIETLAQLQYSQDRRGPFALYIYGQDGYHSGRQWFSKTIRYPDEEILVEQAKSRALAAESEGKEVRICDGGDMLVYHSRGGVRLYPKPGVDFWKEVRA